MDPIEENKMETSGIEDSSDSDDSDASMDEEELQLNQEFLEILTCLSAEKFNYEKYLLLVETAK